MRSALIRVCLAWLVVAAGCTAESSNGPGNGPVVAGNGGNGGSAAGESGGSAGTDGNAAGGAAGGGAGSGEPVGALCPADNATQACTCEKNGELLPGRQVCSEALGWATCECAEAPETILPSTINQGSGSGAIDPAANRTPADFEWERLVPAGGSCEPGRYDGAFDGIYQSGGTFIGIPVMGNVSFELGESIDGEFFEVSGGTMEGFALIVFAFQGEIVGSLDCASGVFEGFMQNCSYVEPGGSPTEFEGPLRARYDPINHVFINGVWGVTERDDTGAFYPPPDVQPGVLLPPLPTKGGVGNWSATLTP
jgi:hypothetical protein